MLPIVHDGPGWSNMDCYGWMNRWVGRLGDSAGLIVFCLIVLATSVATPFVQPVVSEAIR